MTLPPALEFALVAFLVVYGTQRLLELRLSNRNAVKLLARGGVEYGHAHFPLFVVIHALFPLALIAEIVTLKARPTPLWPLWLVLCLMAQALRQWSMHALGEFWTARIVVLPGQVAVRRGPYRWIAHPSYFAATLELAAIPLLFGAVKTACIFPALNALALAVRIPLERRALTEARAISVR